MVGQMTDQIVVAKQESHFVDTFNQMVTSGDEQLLRFQRMLDGSEVYNFTSADIKAACQELERLWENRSDQSDSDFLAREEVQPIVGEIKAEILHHIKTVSGLSGWNGDKLKLSVKHEGSPGQTVHIHPEEEGLRTVFCWMPFVSLDPAKKGGQLILYPGASEASFPRADAPEGADDSSWEQYAWGPTRVGFSGLKDMGSNSRITLSTDHTGWIFSSMQGDEAGTVTLHRGTMPHRSTANEGPSWPRMEGRLEVDLGGSA